MTILSRLYSPCCVSRGFAVTAKTNTSVKLVAAQQKVFILSIEKEKPALTDLTIAMPGIISCKCQKIYLVRQINGTHT